MLVGSAATVPVDAPKICRTCGQLRTRTSLARGQKPSNLTELHETIWALTKGHLCTTNIDHSPTRQKRELRPMLSNVLISKFKSITKQKIEFGRVNVLIGTNGAGKSNILEAIGMLSAGLSGEIRYDTLTLRGVRLSAPDVFKSALKSLGRREPIFTLSANFDNLHYSMGVRARPESSTQNPFEFQSEVLKRNGKRLDGRSPHSAPGATPPANISVVSRLEALNKLNSNERNSLAKMRDFAIYSPSTPILRGVSPDESKKSPLGIYGGGLEKGFSSLLKAKDQKTVHQFFDFFDWIQSIGVTTPSKKIQSSHIHTPNRVVSFKDRYMGSAFDRLYAYDISEGALYVFFVLLLLSLDDTPSIFALDNVDNALNPGMVHKLVDRIVKISEKNDRQLFMTTHNPTALDAIDIYDDQQRIFVVKRDRKTGETKTERILPPKGISKEEWNNKYSGMKLSNLWMDGMLNGALPPSGL